MRYDKVNRVLNKNVPIDVDTENIDIEVSGQAVLIMWPGELDVVGIVHYDEKTNVESILVYDRSGFPDPTDWESIKSHLKFAMAAYITKKVDGSTPVPLL